MQHSVLLLCPVDQVQENEEELYARLTLVCARCRLTLIYITIFANGNVVSRLILYGTITHYMRGI